MFPKDRLTGPKTRDNIKLPMRLPGRLLFFGFVFSLLILFSSTVVLAIGGDSAKSRLEELRKDRQGQIEKLRENKKDAATKLKAEIKDEEASRRAEVKQKVAQKVKDLLLRVVVHQEKTLARLDKIAEKIATRIDKLKEKGVNTQIAESKLVIAESEASAAAAAIAVSRSTVEALDPAVMDEAAVEAAKQALRESKQALFDYHKALVATLRELKASKALREGTGSATQ